MHCFSNKAARLVYCLLALISLPSVGLPLGDPLINLRIFFEHAFRVQFHDPAYINQAHGFDMANVVPAGFATTKSLHPTETRPVRDSGLSCTDFQLLDHEDWQAGFEKARDARANAPDNRVTPDMQWPNYAAWNSPSHAEVDIRRSFLGNLVSAKVTIAFVGGRYDISKTLSLEDANLSDATLERIFAIKGMGYAPLYQKQVSHKAIRVISTEYCETFTIFRLDLR